MSTSLFTLGKECDTILVEARGKLGVDFVRIKGE
jgi:hypothetical protein